MARIIFCVSRGAMRAAEAESRRAQEAMEIFGAAALDAAAEAVAKFFGARGRIGEAFAGERGDRGRCPR